MTTPTIIEVSAYIASKRPEWPKGFCDWYADKFWNTYQSTGWKLSNNVAMKDWQAAFNARWNSLPFDESKAKLGQYLKEQEQAPQEQTHYNILDDMDEVFNDFKQGRINRAKMADMYKFLKSRFTWWTPEEMEVLVRDAGNDKAYGRYLAVKLLFQKVNALGQSITEFLTITE